MITEGVVTIVTQLVTIVTQLVTMVTQLVTLGTTQSPPRNVPWHRPVSQYERLFCPTPGYGLSDRPGRDPPPTTRSHSCSCECNSPCASKVNITWLGTG